MLMYQSLYGYKFLRVIKFCGFQEHQPNCKNYPGEIFVTTPMQEHTPSLGKTSLRMALLRYFCPTTDNRRETQCVVFLRHHLFTDPQLMSTIRSHN